MSQPAPDAAAPPAPTPTGPLAVWLLVQLAAVAVAVERVPLAARYPATGERFALDLLLATQIGFSALLFPWLLRNLSAATLAIGVCWPMLALAGFLAAAPVGEIVSACGFTAVWLAALAIWRQVLRGDRAQAIGAALAGCWAIGGALLWYLRADFNSDSGQIPHANLVSGPILAALDPGGTGIAKAANQWAPIGVLLAAGAIALLIQRLRRPKRAGASPMQVHATG